MENKIFGLGVFVCVFNEDFSKILLLKRNEEKRIKWNADWGNVGGRIEFGETSLEAGIREAKEEIGIELNKANVRLLFVKETPRLLDNVHAIHFVYATRIRESSNIKINPESESYGWFSLDNLPDRMIDKKEEVIQIKNIAKREVSNELA